MVTDKGTVKTATEINSDVYGEMNKTHFTLSIVYTICGAILLAIGIVMVALQFIMEIEGDIWTEGYLFLVFGVVLIVSGIVVMCVRSNSIKSMLKHRTVEEDEFFRDYFISRQYVDGEHLVTAKIYYSRLAAFNETKNYFFIYNTRATVTAVDKRSLTPQEILVIKDLISRGMAKAQTAAQPVQPAPVVQTAPPIQPEPVVQTAPPAQPAPSAQPVYPNPAGGVYQPQGNPTGGVNGNYNGNVGQGY